MAYSYVEFTSNSSANSGKDYTYSFGAVTHDTANIKVTVGGQTLATSLYTVTQGTVTLSAAPGSGSAPLDSELSSTNVMRVFRQTNRTSAEVTFSSASVLQDSDLNTATDQGRYLALEAVDRANESITIDENNAARYNVQVDGADKRIFGIATPVDEKDAVPKSYADSTVSSAEQYRDKAQDHRDTAESYAVKVDNFAQTFSGASNNNSGSGTNTSDYSAKEWAVGKHSGNTDGSSKQWALGGGASFSSGTAVSGSNFSAKEYAHGDIETHGGSAKAWATDTSSPDGSSEKSAKTLAAEAAASASAALASENAANASASAAATVFDKFDDKYLGQMADGASATDADTTGTWTKNSSVITVANASNIVVGQEVTGSGIPTDANVIKVNGTSITISENMDAAGTNVDLDFRGHGVYGAFNTSKDGPATDNDGNTLVKGALYFNTSDSEMRVYDNTNWIPASAAANVTVLDYTFNVTTNTTVFSGTATSGGSLSFASVESIDVFLNGVKLVGNLSSGNDYTLDASANSVTLASAAVNGDVVLVRVYKTFTAADTVPASTGGTFSGNVAYTGNIQVDDIVEKTSAHGVEIDGVTLKDGGGTFTGNVVIPDGNVGIGTNSPDANSKLHISGGSTDYHTLVVDTTASGGGGMMLRHSASNKGYVGTAGSTHLSGSSTDDILIRATNKLVFASNGNNKRLEIDANGNITTGTTNNERIIIGSAGGGIDFSNCSGNAGANVLDDYEEGTWTAGNDGTGWTSSQNTQKYIKIGKLVFLQIYLQIGNSGGTGTAMKIDGIPFTPFSNGSTSYHYYASTQVNTGGNGPSSFRQGRLNGGDDFISILGSQGQGIGSDEYNGTHLIFSLVYEAV